MPDTPLPFSAAAERNQGPILQALRRVLPARAAVLEIASGTGQHAAHFAREQPGWQWQPTDADPAALPAIAARCEGLPNVRPPLWLDVLAAWPEALGPVDAVYCANMLHISPWATCQALMRGAAARLVPGGVLLLYGPFIVHGQPTAPSNLAFDADLRARDARWGLRRLDDVVAEAHAEGLAFEAQVSLPANNLVVAIRRR
jgi:SAM-dependent methyltransferase